MQGLFRRDFDSYLCNATIRSGDSDKIQVRYVET